ncbi:MAG: winged helix-turn-helix transcriptional regulator [Nitrosopumilus sp. B06]|nr:MAG: winged helix-turn-helix transcriptional regulator [Nitrosopumilus sp. D6]RNJ80107.1 MAG: winged helix-turn-helix transcriptional regulator [Nitrosopumilus sp. B06]
MLFVRTDDTIETMVRVPLVITGMIVVALTVPIQSSLGTTRTLDLILYSDGSAHVTNQLDVDPLEPDLKVDLFGSSIDNLIALGENDLLLSSELDGSEAAVSTFGSSSVTVEYDIHDLVSKEGRIWTFALDSHSPYSLLMPPNSIIVGMTAAPSNMDLRNDQIMLQLGAGLSEINYIFGATTPVIEPAPDNDNLSLITLGVALAVSAAGIAVLVRKRALRAVAETGVPEETVIEEPEMREDDKKILIFLSENGGQALESELRKRFLLPRTTMWRAVKRLERQGAIEITKKDQQNLVRLREDSS